MLDSGGIFFDEASSIFIFFLEPIMNESFLPNNSRVKDVENIISWSLAIYYETYELYFYSQILQ